MSDKLYVPRLPPRSNIVKSNVTASSNPSVPNQPDTLITNFGFETIKKNEKESKVKGVFNSVAKHYDLMNDIMSLGIHRAWKYLSIFLSNIRPKQVILDLAGGSGDLAVLLCQKVGPQGKVFLTDINEAMLNLGRDRLLNKGLYKNISYIQGNAQNLPFKNNSFHGITMGFGLRNVTDKNLALREIYRVCKPAGAIIILEFSNPNNKWLQTVYDWYSFNILPKLGKLVTGDSLSYKYLVESIRMHPTQEELKHLITQAGFEDCSYLNFSGGIVALHRAYKY